MTNAARRETEPGTYTAPDVGASARASWQRASEALDTRVLVAAAEWPTRGVSVVALGAYGRRELLPGDEAAVLLVGGSSAASHAAAVEQLAQATDLRPRVATSLVDSVARQARADVDTLIELLDARLVAGDRETFARLEAARDGARLRARRSQRSTLQQRYRAHVAREPWQLLDADHLTGRGGLQALTAVRLLDEERAAALAPEREVLLRARIGGAAAPRRREALLAMRRIDEALAALLEIEPRWRRVARAVFDWQPFGAPAPTVESEASDLDRLLAVLRSPEQPGALEPLPSVPWVERLLPEWRDVRGMSHPDSLRRYPVDVHLRRTAFEVARALADSEDGSGARMVAGELKHPDELPLAALLHGIGESHLEEAGRAGAVIAERFAARAGLDDEAARRLGTVVEQHGLLAAVASRRDIADPAVIDEVASTVGDEQTLHLLYVVSVASARALSPEGPTAWRDALLRTLYLRVLEAMGAAPEHGRSVLDRRRDETIGALQTSHGATEVERHLRRLPPRYLLASSPVAIGQHLDLIAALRRTGSHAEVRHDPVGGFDRLTIVTNDRPGILEAVAGVLALHGVSVLGGNAYTRDDGVVIDVLHVRDEDGGAVDAERWTRVNEVLPSAIAGDYPVSEELGRALAARETSEPRRTRPRLEPDVQVDNTTSSEYSIVEVHAADRPGLLYAVTHVLRELALDVHLAKIETLGDEVFDTFYVLRRNGRRLESADEIERLCLRVGHAIAEGVGA